MLGLKNKGSYCSLSFLGSLALRLPFGHIQCIIINSSLSIGDLPKLHVIQCVN